MVQGLCALLIISVSTIVVLAVGYYREWKSRSELLEVNLKFALEVSRLKEENGKLKNNRVAEGTILVEDTHNIWLVDKQELANNDYLNLILNETGTVSYTISGKEQPKPRNKGRHLRLIK